MAETTINVISEQVLKSILQTHFKFQCIDGMIHQSEVGKNRLFVISCDRQLDVVICQICWAVSTITCPLISSDKDE